MSKAKGIREVAYVDIRQGEGFSMHTQAGGALSRWLGTTAPGADRSWCKMAWPTSATCAIRKAR